MLMETFTRTKPTDEIFARGMTLRLWVKESLPNEISVLADSRFKELHIRDPTTIHWGFEASEIPLPKLEWKSQIASYIPLQIAEFANTTIRGMLGAKRVA
ncbi:hypothetical protein RJ640_024841 [Escallonia rubra]|uniref:Uncharacterized protein n=1 Tax=Escallonia rubra TaxID=112253 RepID=A0AA88QZE4_9ASTE|nr:hypothetical protein RJ640_024841 [Escallonia rubra]